MRSMPERIETERLVLRRWQKSDVDDVFAYASDKEWGKYFSDHPQPFLRGHAEEFIENHMGTDWRVGPHWALATDGKVVGGIDLDLELNHRRAELGYDLGRPNWGRGLVTEAAREVINAAFLTLEELNRIYAISDARNAASRRVMEKVGMRHEATLRQHRLKNGELVDDAYYGLLRREWDSKR